jgi:cytoskeletal protein RodZ
MPDQEPQPHSELASFGEELRREREIRGISLKEISDATKISKRFLEAIERNDHRTLPAPVFTRGFVREYAKYLGLNAEEMVNRYNYAAAGDDRIEKSPHLERLIAPPPPPLPREKPRPKGIPPWYARIDRNLVITAIIVALLIGVAIWAKKHKRESAAEAARESTAVTVAKPAAHPVTPPPETTSASTTTTTTSTATAAADDRVLHLTIDMVGDSWVVLKSDGKTVWNNDMVEGQTKTFDANEEFRFLTIGNAAGVSLTLNGVKLPPLGAKGEVIHDRVLDRDFLQRARGAP